MQNILEAIFVLVGYAVVLGGLTYGVIHVIDSLNSTGSRKREFEKRVIGLLEDFKSSTLPKP